MLLDLKIAWRGLRSRPLFTFVALTTLALGIGANAAMFSVVHAILLRPLPYPASHRLVSLYTRYLPATGYDFRFFTLSGAELVDVRTRADAFEGVAAYDFAFRNATWDGGSAERILTMAVTSEFFHLLRVKPQWGRTFTRDEAQRGDACLAVLDHDFSQRHLGGMAVAGSVVRLDDRPCEVIGVMPRGFGFRDERVQLWTALAIDADEDQRQSHSLLALARVRDDASMQQAESQLQSLHGYWSEQFPDHYAKGHFAVVRPLHEDLVGDQRQTLLLLGGAVGFVLLIVCANVAALLASRGEGRRREYAVRRALGADRLRLLRLQFSETMLLALAGGVLGVVIASWMVQGLLALYPAQLPAWQPVRVDDSALLFALALVGLVGFLIGMLPVLQASGVHLQEALRSDGRTMTPGRWTLASRSGLVSGQIALSVVLLGLAGLLIRTYHNLQSVDLGFDSRSVLTFSVSIPEGRQPDAAAARRTLARIEDRLATLPGASGTGAISSLPVASAGPPDDFMIDGRPGTPAGAPARNARYIMATPGLFDTLRIPLRRGRLLHATDVAGQPLVAVISETTARLYWPGEDPIGRTIRYYPLDGSPAIRIVGIVGDIRSLGPDTAPPPAIYVTLDQAPRPAYDGRSMTFITRARGNPEDLVASVRAAVEAVEPALPIANVDTMETVVSRSLGQPRFANIVMTIFAGVAVFLSALGLYGLLAYSVEQRRREIGLRIALGADRWDILRLVTTRGVRLTAVGLAIGIPAAAVLSRFAAGLFFEVSVTDPWMYAGVAVILGVVSLLASYLPARWATRVDPMIALRVD